MITTTAASPPMEMLTIVIMLLAPFFEPIATPASLIFKNNPECFLKMLGFFQTVHKQQFSLSMW